MENKKQTLGDPSLRWLPWLLFAAVAVLYLAFRSTSLDDFDSYSFALALERFSLTLQQPQPPGFPVYVFGGRVLLALLGDTLASLTLLSALCGAGCVVLIYVLGRDMDDVYTGLGAALLVAIVPMFWLSAEKALSDVPGMFALLLAMGALWRWRMGLNHGWLERDAPRVGFWSRYSGLLLAALLSGLALGLRPQNALPLFFLIFYVAWVCWRQKRPLWPWLLAALVGIGAVMLWLLPMLHAEGGWGNYWALVQEHAAHVGHADSLLGMQGALPAVLRVRAFAFGDTFLSATIGVSLLSPWQGTEGLRLLVFVALLLLGLLRADWRRSEVRLLAIWLLLVAAQIFFFETLDRPRLMLPLLPPLALLLCHGWSRLRRPRFLRPLLMLSVTLLLLIQGVPLASQLAALAAPPAQATAYVAQNYPSTDTLLAAAGSFRAVQVELPDYPLVYLYRFDPEMVQRARQQGARYVVVFDRDKFSHEAMQTLSDGGLWVTLEDRVFQRDRRVHTQHDQVRVQVLAPVDSVPDAALALPADGCVDIGGDADGRYLGSGWFRAEDIAGSYGRWAGEIPTSTMRLLLPTSGAYRVRVRAFSYPDDQQLRLRVGDWAGEWIPVAQAWGEMELELPASALTPGRVLTLMFEHQTLRSPFEVSAGSSSDTRPLALAYDRICFEPLVP